jgi:hypothetical protein
MKNILLNNNLKVRKELDDIFSNNRYGNLKKIEECNSEISTEDFINHFIKSNCPVLVKGGAKKWPAVNKWNFDFFVKNYGNIEVTANLYDINHTRKSTFSQLAGSTTYPQSFYVQEWWFQKDCPGLYSDILQPEYFNDDYGRKILGFNNNTLWMGSKNEFTPLHQDTTYTNIWSAQILGKKEWVLINKNAELYNDSKGKPDYKRFFEECADKISVCLVETGDILYVPFKWWHRAKIIEDSISMNTFFISEEIVSRYIKDLFSIPLATLLNKDLLKKYDPTRLAINEARCSLLTELLGLNKHNILDLDLSGNASSGIYKL